MSGLGAPAARLADANDGSIAQKLRRRREENRPGAPYRGRMRVALGVARVRGLVHQQTDEEQR
jgi:hypothetical protein